MVFVNPSTISGIDHGEAPLNAGTGKRHQGLAKNSVHGSHFDDARLRCGKCVEKGRKALGEFGGANQRENPRTVGAVFLVNIGVNVPLVGRFGNATGQFV